MSTMDLNRVVIYDSQIIPNTDYCYLEYGETNNSIRKISIIDKHFNIVKCKNRYTNYFEYKILDEEYKYINEYYDIYIDYKYISQFDLFIIHRNVYNSTDNYVCELLYKLYEDTLLYRKITFNDHIICDYTIENIDKYFDYSSNPIIMSGYIIGDLLFIYTNFVPQKFMNIIKNINNIKNIWNNHNDKNYIYDFKFIGNDIFEFKINSGYLKSDKSKSCCDLSFYEDHYYVVCKKIDYYLLKIYPDFSKYDFVNLSKIIKENYGDKAFYCSIRLFFDTIIFVDLNYVMVHKLNINELFDNPKYKLHRIGNCIENGDLDI